MLVSRVGPVDEVEVQDVVEERHAAEGLDDTSRAWKPVSGDSEIKTNVKDEQDCERNEDILE